MTERSQIVSIHPYFKVKPGKLREAKALLKQLVAKTSTEPANLYYDFTLNADVVFCREAYVGAEGLLHHIDNIAPVFNEFLKIVHVLRVELHGSAEDLEKLKAPLAVLKPQLFKFYIGVPKSG